MPPTQVSLGRPSAAMMCRPLVTDLHVQRALNMCKGKGHTTPEYKVTMRNALRLIEIKAHQARFESERTEIEAIMKTLSGGDE